MTSGWRVVAGLLAVLISACGLSLWVRGTPGSGQLKTAPDDRKATVVFGTGDWKVEGQELRLYGGTGEQWLLFGNPAWTDYDFSFEVRHEGMRAGVSLLYRSPDDSRIQHFGFGWIDARSCSLGYREGPDLFKPILRGSSRVLAASAEPIQADRWYELKVQVRGRTTRAYCDRKLIFDITNNQYDRGRVGVRTYYNNPWQTRSRFRNFKVTSPLGEVLFEGLPESPN